MTGQPETQTLVNASGNASDTTKSAREVMQLELIAQGREEARESTAKVLADSLSDRFGALSAAHQNQIRNASLAQLQTWIRNSSTVQSIDTLFV